MSYARGTLTDVRRRKRLQAEALAAARVALYRERPTFGEPTTPLVAALVIEEAERIMAAHWATRAAVVAADDATTPA